MGGRNTVQHYRCLLPERTMLPRRKVGDVHSPRQHVVIASSWWGCSGKRARASSNYTCRMSQWLVAVATMVVMLQVNPCCSLEARCPPENVMDRYCQCTTEQVRSGSKINIKCDFQKEEVSVVLCMWLCLL